MVKMACLRSSPHFVFGCCFDVGYDDDHGLICGVKCETKGPDPGGLGGKRLHFVLRGLAEIKFMA